MALKKNEVDFVECNGVQKKFADTFAREAINDTQASITEIENKLTPIIPKANGAIQNVVGDETINVEVSAEKEAQLHVNIAAMLKATTINITVNEAGNWTCQEWAQTGTVSKGIDSRTFNTLNLKIPQTMIGKVISAQIYYWSEVIYMPILSFDLNGQNIQLIWNDPITSYNGNYQIQIWTIETK